jgi:hypothetical protein
MLEVSLSVERGSQVSVVFPDPVSSWGLYTSARWLANRLAFSVSLFAQDELHKHKNIKQRFCTIIVVPDDGPLIPETYRN